MKNMAKNCASSNPEVSECEKGIWNAPEGLQDREWKHLWNCFSIRDVTKRTSLI